MGKNERTLLYRAAIQAYFAAPKTVLATSNPAWQWDERDQGCVAIFPISIADETTKGTLEVASYNPTLPHFKINLFFETDPFPRTLISRLDFGSLERHTNPPPYSETRPAQVKGSHLHSWPDNLIYAKPNEHWPLGIATLTPQNVHRFDAAFRWFCGQNNVLQPHTIFELPPPGKLL